MDTGIIVNIIAIVTAAISVVWAIIRFRERLLTLEYKTDSIDKKLDDLIADSKKFREDYYKLTNEFIRIQTKFEINQPTT